jgi:Zn-dependent peptidase ImmA (M78 family)
MFLYNFTSLKTFTTKEHFQHRRFDRNKKIIDELYNDLLTLFHPERIGVKFMGYLKPLNDTNVLKKLVMVEDNESYTINKQVIHLCTKDPGSGKHYDKNTLMFVVLHELAHVICEEVGHTDAFSMTNQALLDYAIKRGYYDPTKPFVKNYCSL